MSEGYKHGVPGQRGGTGDATAGSNKDQPVPIVHSPVAFETRRSFLKRGLKFGKLVGPNFEELEQGFGRMKREVGMVRKDITYSVDSYLYARVTDDLTRRDVIFLAGVTVGGVISAVAGIKVLFVDRQLRRQATQEQSITPAPKTIPMVPPKPKEKMC